MTFLYFCDFQKVLYYMILYLRVHSDSNFYAHNFIYIYNLQKHLHCKKPLWKSPKERNPSCHPHWGSATFLSSSLLLSSHSLPFPPLVLFAILFGSVEVAIVKRCCGHDSLRLLAHVHKYVAPIVNLEHGFEAATHRRYGWVRFGFSRYDAMGLAAMSLWHSLCIAQEDV